MTDYFAYCMNAAGEQDWQNIMAAQERLVVDYQQQLADLDAKLTMLTN